MAKKYAEVDRVQIDEFLTTESAQSLRDELTSRNDWRHVINGDKNIFEIASSQFDALPHAERARIEGAMYATAQSGFQFQFDTLRVPDSRSERKASGTLLDEFARLMSSGPVIQLISSISGASDIGFADAQATRYRHGDFLTRHDDNVAGKNRRLAYVLGLTPGWEPEWGGVLMFNAKEGGLSDAMSPRFNALSLFAIGQPHSVSYIAPYAGAERLSITGWLRAEAPPD